MLYILLLISAQIAISLSAGVKDFDYYKNLWLENLEIAANWKQPTDNFEFKNISREKCPTWKATYDYVIVGGGTAGSILANRLSKNPKNYVLVLEAGEDENPFSVIPGAYLAATRSDKNWGYTTVPQKNACQQFPNRQCSLPRAKGLGGESSLKDVTYVRGNLQDFESWPGEWPQIALKYFKVFEDATSLNLTKDELKYRGVDGLFHVEYPKDPGPFSNEIYQAHEDLNLPFLRDYNGKTQIGVGNMQAYTKNGQRSSTNQAYLKPIRNRPNLKVLTHALATKIIFSKSKTNNIKAEKLEFLYQDSCHSVNIKTELILTGGPFNTPQLLMLSGIGSKYELYKHNIPQILELPVGKNLEDHLAIRNFDIQINQKFTYGTFDEELKKYLKDGSGSLAEPLARQVSFVNTENPKSCYPDFEIMFTEINTQLIYPPTNLSEPVVVDTISAQILHLHPESKGSVTLKSNDPTDYPRIDPQYLQADNDMKAMVRVIKFLRKLTETPSFKRLNATIVNLVPEECKKLNLKGEEELLRCVVKYSTAPMHHPIATCKMGTNKLNSVVDPELRIHEVQNVRVVDSSVIPLGTSGHTVAATGMIAEAASDYILEKL